MEEDPPQLWMPPEQLWEVLVLFQQMSTEMCNHPAVLRQDPQLGPVCGALVCLRLDGACCLHQAVT